MTEDNKKTNGLAKNIKPAKLVIIIMAAVVVIGVLVAAIVLINKSMDKNKTTKTTVNTNHVSNVNLFINTNENINVNKQPFKSSGIIKQCQFPSNLEQCGQCYCLQTERGCEIIDGSAVSDLTDLIDKMVNYDATYLTSCSSVCPCTIKLLKVTPQ